MVELVEVEKSETVFFDEFVKECSGSGLIFVVWSEHDFAEDASDGAIFHGFRGTAEDRQFTSLQVKFEEIDALNSIILNEIIESLGFDFYFVDR